MKEGSDKETFRGTKAYRYKKHLFHDFSEFRGIKVCKFLSIVEAATKPRASVHGQLTRLLSLRMHKDIVY